MLPRLKRFYAAFGDRGMAFIIYALSLVINSLMTLSPELPSVFPEEISAAGIAAFYSGKDWSGLLGQLGADCGYIHAVFYAPLFLVFDNPYALYRAMLILNAVIVSFIPAVAYHLAAKLGVERVRHKFLTALCSGMYVYIAASSKFIRSEALSCLMVWLLAWCLFAALDKKNRYTRFSTSVLTGFLCAAAFAADTDLIAVVGAVLLTSVCARIFFNQKMLNLPAFLLSLAASLTAEHFLRITVMSSAANSAADMSFTLETSFGKAGYLGTLFGEIYAFMTQSFGMGALAAAIFCAVVYNRVKEGRLKGKEIVLENGTKVYEPGKRKYSPRLSVFGMYQAFSVALAVLVPSVSFGAGKNAAEIGELTGCFGSAAVFFVMVFVFTHGIDIRKLLLGMGIYAYSCLCFGLSYYPYMNAEELCRIPLLMPFRFEESVVGAPTGMSFIIMSSCVFSVFVLLIVLASCARKYITRFVSVAMLLIFLYNTCYTTFRYLPETAKKYSAESAPFKDAAALIYNSPQSPPVIVYDADPRLAATIQFIELETSVSIMTRNDAKALPEACLVIAENNASTPLSGGSYDVVGKTELYTVYAYGEGAINFIRYSVSSASGALRPSAVSGR